MAPILLYHAFKAMTPFVDAFVNERLNSCCQALAIACLRRRTDRFAVRVMDSGGPKEAQVQSYSPGGANVPSPVGTFAQPGKYD